MNAKTVIIGLDGVPYAMIKDFAASGVMPNTARLIDGGFFSPMRSSMPEISNVAWSSMITGKNPAEHGIFGFMELHPNSYRMRFPNYNDLKAPPFWETCQGKSVIINVPSTYPVRGANGVLISGFVSIDLNKSVYPPSLIPTLKEFDYRLDVDAQKAHKSMDLFLEDVEQTLQARIRAARHLWNYCDWQTFMLVFTGTDRLLHFLYDAYEDPNHPHHAAFVDHFRTIDGVVGEIAARLGESDRLIMHSDHGFERLDYDVFVNHLLAEKGYLHFKTGQDAIIENICFGTKAFALDPARIYLNYKGRYPCGTVEAAEAEAVLRDLESLFAALEIEGRKVIRSIHRKQDVYSGPYMDDAPDLLLIADHGFNLKGKAASDRLYSKGIFTGKHTYDTAFLLAANCDTSRLPAPPAVSDITRLFT
ncbi:MAG: alkaline phosphatase family protein [Phycisphaerae bacterium]|nr:alkaline phosphatase family protein [Phycisphaerae bacterium]